jgi:hypothetical protein
VVFKGERVQKHVAHIRSIEKNTGLWFSHVIAENIHRIASDTTERMNECNTEQLDIFNAYCNNDIFFWFQWNLFFVKENVCQERIAWLFVCPVLVQEKVMN